MLLSLFLHTSKQRLCAVGVLCFVGSGSTNFSVGLSVGIAVAVAESAVGVVQQRKAEEKKKKERGGPV